MSTTPEEKEFPLNLLDEIAGGEWEYDLPGDFSQSLAYVLASLTEREQNVIYKRYRDGMMYEAIGKEYGVTRERIRQIIAHALRKLHHPTRLNYLKYGVKGMEFRAAQNALNNEIQGAASAIKYIADAVKAAGGFDRLMKFAEAEEKYLSSIGEEAAKSGIPIENAGLSVRGYNCLKRAGYETLVQVSQITESELRKIRNLGGRAADEIIAKLREYGLKLREE